MKENFSPKLSALQGGVHLPQVPQQHRVLPLRPHREGQAHQHQAQPQVPRHGKPQLHSVVP